MKTYDLLVLPPQDKPVYFIVERDDDPQYNQTDDQRKFLYESHSCPTNWLQPVHMVHDGNSDPHGLIRYVANKKESELPPDESLSPNDRDYAFDDWIASTNGVIPDPIDGSGLSSNPLRIQSALSGTAHDAEPYGW